jgi:hypothetical protein
MPVRVTASRSAVVGRLPAGWSWSGDEENGQGSAGQGGSGERVWSFFGARRGVGCCGRTLGALWAHNPRPRGALVPRTAPMAPGRVELPIWMAVDMAEGCMTAVVDGACGGWARRADLPEGMKNERK